MKFLYQYRTPDNEKHDGVIRAPDKEAAYAALKRKGIKPCRFAEAPGVFNKLFGKGKRWMVIGVLGAVCLVLGATVQRFRRAVESAPVQIANSLLEQTRRQPIGDAGIIEKGIATGWSDVFKSTGDRYFASYAIPGTAPAVSRATEEEIRRALAEDGGTANAEREAGIEVRQIIALVEGMKRECREYIADGTSLTAYHRALTQRQEQEIGYYQRAKSEIERAWGRVPHQEFMSLWERRNAQLRRIGVKLVPWPEE